MVMTDEHKAAMAEGRRRANAERAADRKEQTESGTVEVTYRPFDGDPHSTKWNGIVFKANVPVHLDRNNKSYYIEQLLPKETTGPNGETHTKHKPAMVFMGDIAKTNPSFEVDGERALKLVNKRILPKAGHGWAEDHEDEISVSTEIDHAA